MRKIIYIFLLFFNISFAQDIDFGCLNCPPSGVGHSGECYISNGSAIGVWGSCGGGGTNYWTLSGDTLKNSSGSILSFTNDILIQVLPYTYSRLYLGNASGTATSTPTLIDMGGTYGNGSIGSEDNLKWKMYNTGAGSAYGLGMSASAFEYQVPNGASHVWTCNGDEILRADCNAITTLQNVGIGTTTPQGILDVNKSNTRFVVFDTANQIVMLTGDGVGAVGDLHSVGLSTNAMLFVYGQGQLNFTNRLDVTGGDSVSIRTQAFQLGILNSEGLGGYNQLDFTAYRMGYFAYGKAEYVFTVDTNGNEQLKGGFSMGNLDSASIYALTPMAGTQYYCTDCSGNGITGRIVAFIGSAWRRLLFED